ncbi:MAG: hypothetical protein AAF747_11550, partial [Planctomycetota bacterium]
LRYGTQDLPPDGSLPDLTWAGAERIEHAILVGTPNAGSLHAFEQLLYGFDVGPFLPSYPASVLGTMPSIYQLMPRSRHGVVRDSATGEAIDIFDAEVWIENGWGLTDAPRDLRRLMPDAASDEERRAIGIDHVRRCLARAKHFHRAIDVPATPPAGLKLFLVAGDADLTEHAGEVRDGRFRFTEQQPGDGTVTRPSALMDERVGGEWSPRLRSPIAWRDVTFLPEDHLGLTKSEAFANNVLYKLLEKPRESR